MSGIWLYDGSAFLERGHKVFLLVGSAKMIGDMRDTDDCRRKLSIIKQALKVPQGFPRRSLLDEILLI